MPLHKLLMRSHQEAFGWDTHLVRKTREEYFRTHHPNFNNENTHDLTDIFWYMTKTAGLLGSAIYKIKEAWTGQDELQQANYALRTLTKGLKFFRVVSQSDSPKIMWLMGIHDPDMLHDSNRLTHCPWCRKEGQNEGQPPVDSALQAGPHMWEMFWVPIHHVGGHLLPEPKELPTLWEGRSQWDILISITTSTECARSVVSEWEPGWRI